MLARDLKMTRAELMRRVSGEEYAYWMALYNVEASERKKAEAKQPKGKGRHR